MKTYKSDIEACRQRVDAWWNHSIIDRAVVQITAPRDNSEVYRGPETEDLHRYWTDPAIVIPRLEHALARTFFAGEAFPVMYPVSINMVSILNKFLGAPNRYVGRNTTWSEPIIEDWASRPKFDYNPESEWWKLSRALMQESIRFARDNALQYFVGIPDLNGPTEVLSGLRGAQLFAQDFYDNREFIKPALEEVNKAWLAYWRESIKITHQLGGYFFWMRIWSDLPAVDLQSDVSCLLSPQMFDEYLLPFIDEQTKWVERTIYHLDGPDAIRHLDALLDLPRLTGIQWVQGAGEKPTVEWIPLLKQIQDAGKLVYATCEKHEIGTIMEELKPEGLMLVTQCANEQEAGELLQKIESWT